MGFDLGGLIGGALGAIGDIWSTEQANSAQADLQRQSYEYQKESMQNRHQWEVEDLRKAGLNPILSATNSAGGVISTGAGQAHKADLSKSISNMLNAITNSAVGQNAIDISKKDAESNRINADANKLRAENEQSRNPSAIALNEAQATKFLVDIENQRVRIELEKAMNEAKIDDIYQRLYLAHAETAALVQYYADVGSAAQTSAMGSYMSGKAALENADVQRGMKDIAESNGISMRMLNDSLRGKYQEEFKKIHEELELIADKRKNYEYTHPRGTGNDIDDFGQIVYQLGDYGSALFPVKFNLSD